MELSDRTEREFKARNMSGGTVAIGAVESAGSLILPELLSTFVRKYPNVSFDLYSGYSNDIKEKLDKGLIDIGLLMESVDISKYNFVKLPQKDTWGILVRMDDPLAEKSEVSFREMIEMPLLR